MAVKFTPYKSDTGTVMPYEYAKTTSAIAAGSSGLQVGVTASTNALSTSGTGYMLVTDKAAAGEMVAVQRFSTDVIYRVSGTSSAPAKFEQVGKYDDDLLCRYTGVSA